MASPGHNELVIGYQDSGPTNDRLDVRRQWVQHYDIFVRISITILNIHRVYINHLSHYHPNAALTRCGLVTSYNEIDPGHLWRRLWLVAWRHQAITGTSWPGWNPWIDFSPKVLILWHSESDFTGSAHELNRYYVFGDYTSRSQWVNVVWHNLSH